MGSKHFPVSTPHYKKKLWKKELQIQSLWSTLKHTQKHTQKHTHTHTHYTHTHTQVQLWPPTGILLVDARYCKSSLNSLITSRSSWCGNLKHWNTRTLYMSSTFINSTTKKYSLFKSDCACVPNQSCGSHHKLHIKWPEFVASGKLMQSSLVCVCVGGWWCYKQGPWLGYQ